MNDEKETLPEMAELINSTPVMTETSVAEPILKRHVAPEGKYGRLVVLRGALQFIWEDTGEILEATADHPIIIPPGRFHHVQLTGPVEFKVEFYKAPFVSSRNKES